MWEARRDGGLEMIAEPMILEQSVEESCPKNLEQKLRNMAADQVGYTLQGFTYSNSMPYFKRVLEWVKRPK